MPSTYEGEQVELGVIPSSNTNAIAGVRHMRNGDWSLASQCFGRALEENPEDHLVLFADGVCYEKRGDDRLLVGATEHKLTRGRNVISNNRRAEQDVLTIALADYTEALKLYKQANYNQPSVQGDASIRRLSAKIMRTKERQGDRQ